MQKLGTRQNESKQPFFLIAWTKCYLSWVCTCGKWCEGLTNLFSTHQFNYVHLLHVFIGCSNEWKRIEVDRWPPERFVIYRNLKIRPRGINLSGSSKWGRSEFWHFSCESTPTSHAVSLFVALLCTYIMIRLCNNSKCCLSSFVSSSFCTVLLLWWFLPNITACINRWAYFWEKSTLYNCNFIRKRGWSYFRGIKVREQDKQMTATTSSTGVLFKKGLTPSSKPQWLASQHNTLSRLL